MERRLKPLDVRIDTRLPTDIVRRIDKLGRSWVPPLKRAAMARLAIEAGLKILEGQEKERNASTLASM